MSTFLDLDRIHTQALNYALSLSGRTLHGLKTHMIHANHLYQILTQARFSLNEEEKLRIQDFDLSRIEMDGHMSIMRLDTFKGCKEEMDLESGLKHLMSVYQIPRIEAELHCAHHSQLNLDRDIFTATVGNIIKNAFDHSNRRVWVATAEDDSSIQIRVSNTGSRIPREKLNQLLKGEIADPSGTGLGLPICQTWLKKLGGTFHLDSHAGSTVVEITFPLTKKSGERTKPEIPPIHSPSAPTPVSSVQDSIGKLRIAIIDDVASFRLALSNQLQTLAAESRTFETLKDFLDEIERNPLAFHAVIVDRHLRGENAVRDRFPDSCRYLGFKGMIILYSCDPSDSKNAYAKNEFDLLLPKDEEIDWRRILAEIKAAYPRV